jgi:single-strand DNA-binding protein
MMSFAKISIAGTISAAPEKRFTSNNVAVTVLTLQLPPVVKMSATAPKADTPASFLKVVCWRNLADVAEPLPIGQVVLVEGRLQLNTIQQQDGTKKKLFEVDASNLFLLSGLPEQLRPVSAGAMNNGATSSPATARSVSQPTAPATAVASAPSFQFQSDLSSDDFLTEDDIPF